MNGSPDGVHTSFLQSLEPPRRSSEPRRERAEGILASAKTPTICAEGLEESSEVVLESGKEGTFHRVGLGAFRKGCGMGKRKKAIDKDDLSEDYCFVCKDGGEIRVCDFKACLKSYHPQCVKKDESFLESDERWTCDWHLCYNCHKSSTLKCFCCPYSSCRTCFGGSELVKVKGPKGFCINCLRLAKLIEENVDVDSDGEIVDFADTDTYEFLFKDYWEIIKEKERLTLANLQAADDLLKGGEQFKNLQDSDENFEEQGEVEGSDDDCGKEIMPSKDFMWKQSRMSMVKEKSKSKKKTFIGWASKELIEFLISLGKDTQQPLGQHDVYEIIKDYIQSNNLLRHDKKKKKHVFCDARLLSLFRRKKVNFFKVYSLLEKHFAENDDSDDESFSLEEDNAKSAKKQRMDKSPSKQKIERGHFIEHALQPPKKCFAALTEANIKLIYLKRSLIVELMKDLNTFETKVVGCFVRRKSDPKDNYGHGPFPKMYQLNQITGVIKASEEYKLGDMNADIVLCVSNYCKGVQISMLSDDNFEEEECEDLRQLVKEGLFTWPSIDELKEKIRTVHEDMVKHSVKKELLKLEKLIERANEKGWRRELFDYIERKKLLNKPEEIMRLMKELPDVTVDIEVEAEAEGAISHVPAKNVTNLNKAEVQGGIQNLKSSVLTTTKQRIFEEKSEDGVLRTSLGDAANPDLIITEEKHEDADPNSSLMDATNSESIIAESTIEGHDSSDSKVNTDTVVIEIDDEEEATHKVPADVHIIDLDVAHGDPIVENGTSHEKIWNYLDPSGNVQGPFTLRTLEHWMEEGFFDEDFRIWKASQSQQDAIPLGVALGLLRVP